MYSRYIPNGRGGFDRQFVPEPPPKPGTLPSPGPPKIREPSPPGPPPRPGQPLPHPPGAGPEAGPPGSTGLPGRPGAGRPGPGPPEHAAGPPFIRPAGGGRPGPGALLTRLLPHGADAEDLLILAVLALSMYAGGADALTVAIAAGLYLLLSG